MTQPAHQILSEPGGRVPLSVVLLMLLAALVLMLTLRRSPDEGGESDVAVTPAPADSGAAPLAKLNPEPYRSDIERLEGILYSPRLGTADDFAAIAFEARALARAIRGQSHEPTRHAAFDRLSYYADEAEGRSAPDLPRLRAQWEQVRDQVFISALWYQRSTAALTAAQRRTGPQPVLSTLERIMALRDDLVALIETGEREALDIVEDRTDPDAGVATLSRGERWQTWSTAWRDSIAEMERRLHALPPMEETPNLELARQRLSRALAQLREVSPAVRRDAVPQRLELESHFRIARNHVAAAVVYIERAR